MMLIFQAWLYSIYLGLPQSGNWLRLDVPRPIIGEQIDFSSRPQRDSRDMGKRGFRSLFLAALYNSSLIRSSIVKKVRPRTFFIFAFLIKGRYHHKGRREWVSLKCGNEKVDWNEEKEENFHHTRGRIIYPQDHQDPCSNCLLFV